MKVELDGAFDVTTSPEETFAFLVDPERFAPMLPHFKELKNVQAGSFTIGLEIGIPQIRGRVDVDARLLESVAPQRAHYKTSGRHTLGIVDSDLSFAILPNATGSSVQWKSESIVNGTLASLAQGILIPLAKRQIKTLVNACQNHLGAPAGPDTDSMLKRGTESVKSLFRSGGNS